MASPVDVGGLLNHVKYCVSVLSLQWTKIRTSPLGIPYNWYQSIWFEVVFDFCSKMKVVKIVF
jgi:hypothetical protein